MFKLCGESVAHTPPNPTVLREKLSLGRLRTLIPKECFEKSLPKSLAYMVRDIGVLCLGLYLYPRYFAGSAVLTAAYWLVMGFFMWCLFVIGHDCGHGTFSNYPVVNDTIGHLCHAMLCVPYYPWRKSHHHHHMYHNHIQKDLSFPWVEVDRWQSYPLPFRAFMASPLHPLLTFGIGYLVFGVADGSHFFPLDRRLFWNRREQIECVVSVASVAAFLYLLVGVWFEGDWWAVLTQYGGPWFIYNYWLVMVTYMQHHHDETETYDDSDFHFAVAALQTVDREYGWGIDNLHHNITDGHVVHHLFFTKIPHYSLMKATKALRPYLTELGVYHHEKNHWFLWDFAVNTYRLGFTSHSKNGVWQKPAADKKAQ